MCLIPQEMILRRWLIVSKIPRVHKELDVSTLSTDDRRRLWEFWPGTWPETLVFWGYQQNTSCIITAWECLTPFPFLRSRSTNGTRRERGMWLVLFIHGNVLSFPDLKEVWRNSAFSGNFPSHMEWYGKYVHQDLTVSIFWQHLSLLYFPLSCDGFNV